MMPAATYSTLSKLINKLHSMTGFVAKFVAAVVTEYHYHIHPKPCQ